MSKRMNSRLVVVLSALSLFLSNGIAAPEGWVIQQISNGGMIGPGFLAVHGDQVAYTDGGQVMIWTVGQQPRQISSGQNDCSEIQLSDGTATWREINGDQRPLMFWDGQSARQISSGQTQPEGFQLSDGKVAWIEHIDGKGQVMLWDGQTTRQLTNGMNNCYPAQLSNDTMAWTESIQNKFQVMFWDGQTTRQLSSGQNSCDQLQLSNGKVAWREDLGSNQYLVIFWDGRVGHQLTSGQTYCLDVNLFDGKVAWTEQIQDAYQVMFWDGQATRQLSSGQGSYEVQLSEGKVVWMEWIGGGSQMMYWDGLEGHQLTKNLKEKNDIHMSNDRIVWREVGINDRHQYIYCWENNQKTLLTVIDASKSGHIFNCQITSTLISWIGLDSMDDAQVFVAMKGETPAAVKGPEGDVNRDLKVDIQDLAIVSANWLGKAKERITGETLDRNPGWVVQGPWEFGRPTGMGGTEKGFADPQAGVTGRNVYGVNLYGDYSTKVGGPYCLTAGPFDCSGYEKVGLAFARWLNTDSAEYVRCTVEVSNDGSQWQTVWANPAGAGVFDSVWQAVSYDIEAVANGQAKVWVRWTHRILSDRAFACSGWNIDDVEVWGERK